MNNKEWIMVILLALAFFVAGIIIGEGTETGNEAWDIVEQPATTTTTIATIATIATVSGTAIYEDGRPAKGIVVALQGKGYSLETRVSEDGTYKFDDIPFGEYVIGPKHLKNGLWYIKQNMGSYRSFVFVKIDVLPEEKLVKGPTIILY